MARSLRLVLGDQLSDALSSLKDADEDSDLVLMAEVAAEATYVRHHPKKIALVFAAMRQFAGRLREAGFTVRYVRLDDEGNTGSLKGEVERALVDGDFERVVLTEPGEWRLSEDIKGWSDAFGLPVIVREDDRFLCSHDRFRRWADGRKAYRMEFFYREMRRDYDILMDGDEPVGGEWNYDAENRKKLPASAKTPPRAFCEPNETVREVLDLVEARFGDHFGDLRPFSFATTHADAERLADDFFERILPGFGDYQDAMAKGEVWLWHSALSMSLNIGLLEPLSLCRRAEEAYRKGRAPLNAVEGFIRQILGWREFVRGLYWLKMPGYADLNALGADRALPDFYWTGDTDMACLAEAIGQTKREAYSHHIQRLMVTGNFAMLAGVAPKAINDWYLAVYADAFEWVELPNTHGMATFADGGIMASKPYAASGAYINRMSDFCAGCRYDPKAKTGDKACPFNPLYWRFLIRHEDRLRSNPRLSMVYRNVDRLSATERRDLVAAGDAFLERIGAVPQT